MRDIHKELRHKIIDDHILMETILHNVISKYFCDSEETSFEFLFYVMQKENSCKIIIDLLENLKLYEKKWIGLSEKEYKKGIASLRELNYKRNKVVHNVIFKDVYKNKLIVNVVKSGKVKPLEINKEFIQDLEKCKNESISFLGGLLLTISMHKGFIKDGSGNKIEL